MRSLPDYPAYKTAYPPVSGRWLSAGAAMVLLGVATTGLLPSTNDKTDVIAAGIVVALAVTGLGWMMRLLFYRVSVHNARFYEQLVDYEQQQWWVQHRQHFSLPEVVLLGPAGSGLTDWQRLLNRENRPPEEKKENGGRTLRLPQISTGDVVAREKRLAENLVLEWRKQRNETSLSSPLCCYWQGAEAAWQAFTRQMSVTFPEVTLPAKPEPWQGEASLSEIASGLAAAPSGSTILVAGCQSVALPTPGDLPAGESAMLWLAGKDGPLQLARGEFFSPDNSETLSSVCLRAQQQSELTEPPEACLLFSQPELSDLAQSGWDVTHYLQDPNWGDTGNMEALVVISLAAIYTTQHQKPCGWIARDPVHTLALGIIKPDGQN